MNRKTILNLINNHQWRRMYFQLGKYIVASVCVPTIIFTAIFAVFYANKAYEDYESTFAGSAYKSAENFNAYVESFIEICDDAMENDDLMYYLSDNINNDYISELLAQTNAQNALKQYISRYDMLEGVSIYYVKNDVLISSCNSYDIDENDKRAEIAKWFDSGAKCMISKNTYITGRVDREKEAEIITLSFPIYTVNFNRLDGVMMFNVLCKDVNNIFCDENVQNNGVTILSNGGNVVAITGEQISTDINFDDIKSKAAGRKYFVEKNGLGRYCYIPYDDYIMIFSSGSKSRNKLISMIVFIVFEIFLISMLAMVVLAYVISMMVFDFMVAFVYESDLYLIDETKEFAEHKYLAKKFFGTMKKESKIEDDFAQKVKQLRDTQILALQTQINPHFIFNTLNYINLMLIRIVKGDSPPSKAVSLLSDILHYSLSTEEVTATLEEELSYARKYVEIEQLKHGGNFKMSEDIDAELLQCRTVKFSLQPILENCIMHAFTDEKENSGMINLKIYKEEGKIHILIKDNGGGAPCEKIAELNNGFKNTDNIKHGRHIGLVNVNQRLKIIFGEDAAMSVYNDGGGFAVEMSYSCE